MSKRKVIYKPKEKNVLKLKKYLKEEKKQENVKK